MTALIQRNRVYSLIVGTQEDAVEINNLNVAFEVTKTSDNREKKNQARVAIYNLSKERRKALESNYVTVALRAGYLDALRDVNEIPLLFSGQVTDLKVRQEGEFLTQREGTDIVTILTIDELFEQMNMPQVSKTIPAGKTVRDVIVSVVQDLPEVTRHEMGGQGINKVVPDGYPLMGSPRQLLDEVSKTYNLEWQIDNGVLYVSDKNGVYSDNRSSVIKIGQFSGLIERPRIRSEDAKTLRYKDEYKNSGSKGEQKQKVINIHCKCLMNASILAGSIIYLDFEDIENYYKVDEVTHRGEYLGNMWESELVLRPI